MTTETCTAPLEMSRAPTTLQAWLTLAMVSMLFFLTTASTFTSLGVVLPSMVEDLGWNWTAAGVGYSLLGVSCGLSSYAPAWVIKRIGVRTSFLCGGVLLAAAFSSLASAQGVGLYYLGMLLAGFGHSMLSTVPGTYLLARCFKRRSFAFGLYFTIGGLGGVVGPWIFFAVMAVADDWRMHWAVLAVVLALAAIIAALLVDTVSEVSTTGTEEAEKPRRIFRATEDWSVSAAVRTPQFVIIASAYMMFLFCGITVNSFSVAHLSENGVDLRLAGIMLSLQAFINAASRAGGGYVGDIMEPKLLMIISLSALVVGLVALSFGNTLPVMLVYTAGIGIGYGLTFVASTVLLLNYFGRTPNLELFSIVNVIATVASAGPAYGGWVRDHFGSFAPAYLSLAVLVGAVLIAALFMRPPAPASATQKKGKSNDQ